MSEATDTLISQELLELLVCPVDHADLEIVGQSLRCTSFGRTFTVQDGIPNMLVDPS